MPRPVRPWFRLYVEALHDPKLRRMPPAHRWVWVAVLGAARQSHEPGVLMVSETQAMDEHDLADIAAVPLREIRKALEAMQAAGMVTRADDGTLSVPKWRERQFETDNTTVRTRKHRSNDPGRNVPTSSVGTPPESESETETYQRRPVNSRGPDEHRDDDPSAAVPDETWMHYASLKLATQTNVNDPIPWKATTARNARTELASQAMTWWNTFDVTPYRLAQALVDGQAPRHATRRNGVTP